MRLFDVLSSQSKCNKSSKSGNFIRKGVYIVWPPIPYFYAICSVSYLFGARPPLRSSLDATDIYNYYYLSFFKLLHINYFIKHTSLPYILTLPLLSNKYTYHHF